MRQLCAGSRRPSGVSTPSRPQEMPPGAWPGGCSPGTQISTAPQISRFLSEQGRGVLFRELHSIPGSLKPQQSLRGQWGTQVAAVVIRCPAGKPPSSSFPPVYNSFISKCQPLKDMYFLPSGAQPHLSRHHPIFGTIPRPLAQSRIHGAQQMGVESRGEKLSWNLGGFFKGTSGLTGPK